MHLLIFLFFFFPLLADQIQLGDKILNVEIADTYETRAKGLMGRLELENGSGMLFVYEKPERLCFWMKNTLIPLSIAFFDNEKTLIQILDMDPPIAEPFVQYRSKAPALYALEVPQGWFQEEKIKPGIKFSFLDASN